MGPDEPVDDIRAGNPPNPKLLDYLSRSLGKGFDVQNDA